MCIAVASHWVHSWSSRKRGAEAIANHKWNSRFLRSLDYGSESLFFTHESTDRKAAELRISLPPGLLLFDLAFVCHCIGFASSIHYQFSVLPDRHQVQDCHSMAQVKLCCRMTIPGSNSSVDLAMYIGGWQPRQAMLYACQHIFGWFLSKPPWPMVLVNLWLCCDKVLNVNM